jgi:coproporphyrinogen III oxidase-like Fe-S oxidoreductase
VPPVAPPDVPFGVYVHVPFCAARCGYCDFNTYTATELGGGGSQAAYAGHAVSEVEYAGRVLGLDRPPVSTVFFGGGTPTLLPAGDLTLVLAAVRETFGLVPGAEVTTEANPDSVTPESLAALREAGFTRVSFGMQSAVTHVLRVLERTHDPANDWATSVEAALACEPDHVSAYSLIVEEGTRLARQVRTGVIPAPDDDDLAEKYVLADEALSAAGLEWYEVSNWARDDAARCRHNELYWTSASWWGIGPGAHSHVAGERWWNVKHPSAYAARILAGESPALDGEVLDAETRALERVLLEVRLRDGLPADLVDRARLTDVAARGLGVLVGDRLVLTRRGRLLADAVVRELVG